MRIIAYHESFSAQKLRELKPYLLVLAGICVLVIGLAFLLYYGHLTGYWWWFVVFVVITAFYILKEFSGPIADEIRGFRMGKAGEEAVCNMLKTTLDDTYVYVLNYLIPNTRIGDIDGLLIGPKGVLIIEVKDYPGAFRVSAGDLFRRVKGDLYRLYRRSPFKQTLQQKEYLQKYLKEKGIDAPMIATVVLVDGKISAINGETKVFITELNNLTNHLFKLNAMQGWDKGFNDKVIMALGLRQTD